MYRISKASYGSVPKWVIEWRIVEARLSRGYKASVEVKAASGHRMSGFGSVSRYSITMSFAMRISALILRIRSSC